MCQPDKPWNYETAFESCRKAWDEHDKTCESLRWMWFGRPGGVSCLSDLTDCHKCGVTFFNEGTIWANPDDPDAEYDIYLCECCRRYSCALVPVSNATA